MVNSGGAQCAACTLQEAITRSLNTTFYGLAYEVGAGEGAETSRAGRRASRRRGTPDTARRRQADRWPTRDGRHRWRDRHRRVRDAPDRPGGRLRHLRHRRRPPRAVLRRPGDRQRGHRAARRSTARARPSRSIAADVANDVTFALEDVADVLASARWTAAAPVASKTGTQGWTRTDNSDAWMVGYTPSLSTAVWMGTDSAGADHERPRRRSSTARACRVRSGRSSWTPSSQGTPEEQLPDEPLIKGDTGKSVPEPSPAPTPARRPPTPRAGHDHPSPRRPATADPGADRPETRQHGGRRRRPRRTAPTGAPDERADVGGGRPGGRRAAPPARGDAGPRPGRQTADAHPGTLTG